MELKRPFKLAGALGATAAAGMVGALVFAAPAQAETMNIPINPGNVPTLASEFEDQSCDQVPEDLLGTQDGWVFVLPSAAGAEGNFIKVYATYLDEAGEEHSADTEYNGGVVDGSGDNKAYITTPAGWELVDATADVEDPDDGAQFNLTHTCPAEGIVPPVEESPTAPEESEAPAEETCPPAEEGTEAEADPSEEATEAADDPCAEDTTEAAEKLPTTGTPLTVALVAAAALAAGGGAMVFWMRRRRAAQDW